MWRDSQYVAEKLREIDAKHVLPPVLTDFRDGNGPAARNDASRRPPVVSPLLRLTGAAIRRMGERLESWASAGGDQRAAERKA